MLGNFIGFFDYGFVLFVGIVVNDILLVIVIVIVWDVINYSNILGGVIIVKLIWILVIILIMIVLFIYYMK